jgi:hypothetical protein
MVALATIKCLNYFVNELITVIINKLLTLLLSCISKLSQHFGGGKSL